MILVSKYIVPKGYVGITIYPFVFLKYEALKEDTVLLNHERIHLQQQIELLIIPFFVIYGFEFLIRLLQYKRWSLAYRNISFEREAYFQEAQLNYLKHRRLYSFLKYL
ncbi:hypothetical protein [Gaetbulibacter sp. PBL-D1]|uniref:hypothetical protein n=1 Tax=Gaetbulibacter sp. PBL-D1 TaxID=3422594 RepID=UPI003D2F1005